MSLKLIEVISSSSVFEVERDAGLSQLLGFLSEVTPFLNVIIVGIVGLGTIYAMISVPEKLAHKQRIAEFQRRFLEISSSLSLHLKKARAAKRKAVSYKRYLEGKCTDGQYKISKNENEEEIKRCRNKFFVERENTLNHVIEITDDLSDLKSLVYQEYGYFKASGRKDRAVFISWLVSNKKMFDKYYKSLNHSYDFGINVDVISNDAYLSKVKRLDESLDEIIKGKWSWSDNLYEFVEEGVRPKKDSFFVKTFSFFLNIDKYIKASSDVGQDKEDSIRNSNVLDFKRSKNPIKIDSDNVVESTVRAINRSRKFREVGVAVKAIDSLNKCVVREEIIKLDKKYRNSAVGDIYRIELRLCPKVYRKKAEDLGKVS